MDESKGFNLIEEILSSLDEINDNPEESGLKILSSLLAMEDNKFEVVKNIFLDEFEKEFNTPEAQLQFAQMMNINGLKLENLIEGLDQIYAAVDAMNEEDITKPKKDFLKNFIAIFINSISNSEGIAKRIIQIPIELCNENAKLPTYATNGSAAMDVYSPEEYTINPGETKIIPLGFKVNIPRGYALLLQPRSGLSVKTKLRVANTPGLIDSDFHEEIGLIIENISDHLTNSNMTEEGIMCSPLYGSSYTIGKGERCAQMRLIEVPMISWLQVDSIGEFNDNHGAGFGSTGTK